MEKIRVVVSGSCGRMGQEVVDMVNNNSHFELVAMVDSKYSHQNSDRGIPEFPDCLSCFRTINADVLVDFTAPGSGMQNAIYALENKVRPVVGTTGFSDEEINQLSELAAREKVGCIIAPNFAIGAVLMMQFSKIAAKYYDDVEIIEMHHDQKLDAPSGTASKTAELISEERKFKQQGHPDEQEIIVGSRGADFEGMRIHSVRLPGLVAHQQVLFGGTGELLSIKHDSFHRNSFMTGVKLSIETVMKLEHLVYGLENIVN